MQRRFIFSLRFFTKVLLKLSLLSLMMVFFMTLFRVNLYFLTVFKMAEDVGFFDVVHSFVTGLRFDILIFGFVLVPLYFVALAQAILQKWSEKVFYAYKGYFSAAWVVICVFSFLDFFYFSVNGQRMRAAGYEGWNFDLLVSQMQATASNQIWIFSVITVILMILGLMFIWGLRFGDWKDEFSPYGPHKMEIPLRIIVPLLLIVLAARGTVEAHHLRFEHSQITPNKAINEMALNAVWCFDK